MCPITARSVAMLSLVLQLGVCAMVMVNKVIVAGNITADPELRFIANGSAVCEFTIALNRAYTRRQTQERVEETAFVDVVAWGRTAEVCGEYLKKGRATLVE